MLLRNQRGVVTPMAIPMIVLTVVVVIMTGIAIWSYSQYSSQRNNVDALIEEAIVEAREGLRIELQAEFDEKEKSPLKTYRGSAALGSITVSYPKTWSAYVEEQETGNTPINGYFHPGYVPKVKSDTAFALRLVLEDDPFSDETRSYEKGIKNGSLKSKPINISGVEGVKLDGEIAKDRQGSIVLIPLRDKTIKISTESKDFLWDFTNIILENLSFIP